MPTKQRRSKAGLSRGLTRYLPTADKVFKASLLTFIVSLLPILYRKRQIHANMPAGNWIEKEAQLQGLLFEDKWGQLTTLGFTETDLALSLINNFTYLLGISSGVYHLVRSLQPQKLEKNLRERIEELSPNQHAWFDTKMAALKRRNLSPEEYGTQMLLLLAQAGEQDE
jgi:hypothetical protein